MYQLLQVPLHLGKNLMKRFDSLVFILVFILSSCAALVSGFLISFVRSRLQLANFLTSICFLSFSMTTITSHIFYLAISSHEVNCCIGVGYVQIQRRERVGPASVSE